MSGCWSNSPSFGVFFNLALAFNHVSGSTNFIGVSPFCLLDWNSLNHIPKTSLALATSLCLAKDFPSHCRGVRCANNQCQDLSSLNQSNVCIGHWRATKQEIYLRNVSVTAVPDIVMVVPEQGELKSITINGSVSVPMPPLIGPQIMAQVGEGILACNELVDRCQYWAYGSPSWKPFPSLQVAHNTGALHVLNGQPIVVGGTISSLNSTDLVEIYDGNTWIWGPSLAYSRAQFGSVVINEVTLVVVAGYSNTQGFLRSVEILSANDMIWTPLPNYPRYVYSLACGHVQLKKRDHVLCTGGERKQHYPTFALDLSRSDSNWERIKILDSPEGFARGVMFQWEHYLYYLIKQCHYPSRWSLCNRVYKLDLDADHPK